MSFFVSLLTLFWHLELLVLADAPHALDWSAMYALVSSLRAREALSSLGGAQCVVPCLNHTAQTWGCCQCSCMADLSGIRRLNAEEELNALLAIAQQTMDGADSLHIRTGEHEVPSTLYLAHSSIHPTLSSGILSRSSFAASLLLRASTLCASVRRCTRPPRRSPS